MAEFGQLIIILLCMSANAFFAGMETGITSIHRMRLRHFIRKGQAGTSILYAYIEDSDRFLGTTLVGTNIFLVIASVVSASLAEDVLGEWGETISALIVSALVLTFSEYIPKLWFRNRPLERSLRFIRLLRFSEVVLNPISKGVILLTRFIVPGPRKSFAKPVPFVTVEDLKLLAHEGEQHGVLSPEERVMIHRVFELSDKTADQLMAPIKDLVSVNSDATVAELFDAARESKYTRIPIRNPRDGKYVGVVNVFYLLSQDVIEQERPVRDFMRRPLFIPGSMPADEIFPRLRRAHQPMGLVTDENGEVIGLLTTEDILEEIVGEL